MDRWTQVDPNTTDPEGAEHNQAVDVVDAILKELDNRGLGGLDLKYDDPEVFKELHDTLVQIVKEILY